MLGFWILIYDRLEIFIGDFIYNRERIANASHCAEYIKAIITISSLDMFSSLFL